jgi:hypothetical protein
MEQKSMLEDMIRSSANALDLRVKSEWIPSIRAHLEVLLAHGKSVGDFQLSDDADLAPIFRA